MKNKKNINAKLMEIGDEVFWKTFIDRDEAKEQRYIIIQDGKVIVMNGKMRNNPRKIVV